MFLFLAAFGLTFFRKFSSISAYTFIIFVSFGLTACGGGGSGSTNTPSVPTQTSSLTTSTSSSLSSSAASIVSSSASATSLSSSVANESLSLLHTEGAQWVNSKGTQVLLKGTNLGNWLMQELWMMGQDGNSIEDQCTLEAKLIERFGYSEKERLMKLLRDSWITTRDWDQLQALGFNLVRIPFIWTVIENEKSPKTLRADAWSYFDGAVAEAKKRGIYVIFDLAGAQGSQSVWTSSGCANQNLYWNSAENQDRVKWLWQQIATRYRDEPTVAAYDLLNEPWGSTSTDMVNRITELYDTVRLIDTKHILLLPSYFDSIDVYGDLATKGMTNVAFELHPYPGLFAESSNDTHYNIHRDWLRCGANGADGVCAVNAKITAFKTTLLMGEFQPWQNAGLELGGKITRATYDTYASYGWAATSWAYKVVSTDGGQGQGSWGIVTNTLNNEDSGMGMAVNASTWSCANWNSTFANGCAKAARTIKVGGSGTKTYYLAIKTGANAYSNLDVTYDNISLVNNSTQTEILTNGNFGSSTGWTALNISNIETVDFNYNAGDKTPIGGSGSVLRVSRPIGTSGEINGAIYQKVTLEGGQTYTLSGGFRDNGSGNTWSEIHIVDIAPVAGQDIVDKLGQVDFATSPITDIEQLFKSYATQLYEIHPGLVKYLLQTPTTIYTLPKPPTGLKLVQGIGSIALNWTTNTETDITGYKIYRGTQAGNATLLATTNNNSYSDLTAVNGIVYYYSISATDAEDEGYRSDEIATTPATNAMSIPAKVEAENYSTMSGIQIEDCTDLNGGKDVGYFDPEDYLEFRINSTINRDVFIDYRLASDTGSLGFELLLDGTKIDALAVPATGGWQVWQTISSPRIRVSAGTHNLRFRAIGGQWNLNYLDIKAAN